MRSLHTLKANEIQTGLHYPLPLHREMLPGLKCAEGSFPVTERVAAEILSLPMFPGLTDEQQQRVTTEIGAFCARPEPGTKPSGSETAAGGGLSLRMFPKLSMESQQRASSLNYLSRMQRPSAPRNQRNG